MELDTILNIMTKYKLTADELLLVYLTFLAQSENGDTEKHKVYFKRWYDGGGKERLRTLFNSLKEKGVIVKNYNPNSYDFDEIKFNKNFLSQYWKLTGELGQELRRHYPTSLYVNGQVVSLKNISKKFSNWEDLYFWYSATIKHNRLKHQEVLEILEWAKDQDLVNISLIEFIASNKWEEWKEMKQKGISGKSTTYDIYGTA